MKKYLLSALFVFSSAVTALAADFQWGASAADLKSYEKSPPKREAVSGAVTYLIFPGTFGGESVSVIDRLIHDKLFEISFVFESRGRKCAELGKKFSEIVSELTAKHGAPDPMASEPGDACNSEREWDLGETTLVVLFSTKSGRSDLSAVYSSKALTKIAEMVSVHAAP